MTPKVEPTPPELTRNLASGLRLLYVILTVTSFAFCVYCVGNGKDLLAAYWASLGFLAPNVDRWLREAQ
ncbi:MAG: hypothetical protein QM784_23275 [Polyangiaceae bacterium]